MRDQLIGYLLDALEPHEHAEVERQLAEDESLRRELLTLKRSLHVLDAASKYDEPPPGLAQRTLQFVETADRLKALPCMSPDRSLSGGGSQWRIADLVVATGVLIAASLLFIPAVSQSRYSARIFGCQNNLRQLGVALGSYSERNHRYFPHVPAQGPLAAAGVYAQTLVYNGFLDDQNLVICPASPLAENARTFRVPTTHELMAAEAPRLAQLQREMGGSYGYTLGYVSKGRYRPTKNFGRSTFALMADTPSCGPGRDIVTENHAGIGQNVLFEDGHVANLTNRTVPGCGDDIFLNDQGEVCAGMHRDDAVIAPSPARPLIWPIALQGEDE